LLELRQQPGERRFECGECIAEAPPRAIGLVDLVRHCAYLNCWNSSKVGRTKYRESLHGLDLAAGRSTDAGARSDREDARFRKRPPSGGDELRIGLQTRENQTAVGCILVHGLGADHKLGRRDAASAGDADVEKAVRPMLSQRARGGGSGFDGSDAASKRSSVVRTGEFVLGGRDDEDHRRER
jgi:hypothetical protein